MAIDLVPETGLEPAHQMAYAPKAYVYTNFTTRARFARPRLRERARTDYIILGTKKPHILGVAFFFV